MWDRILLPWVTGNTEQVELKPTQSTTRDLKQVAAGAHSLITGRISARTKWVTHPMIKVARMHPEVD